MAKSIDKEIGFLSLSFKSGSGKAILKQFEPKLNLDHNLPERLELQPLEKEVFYGLHFAFFAIGKIRYDPLDGEEWNPENFASQSILKYVYYKAFVVYSVL